jgi:hypothetical protein
VIKQSLLLLQVVAVEVIIAMVKMPSKVLAHHRAMFLPLMFGVAVHREVVMMRLEVVGTVVVQAVVVLEQVTLEVARLTLAFLLTILEQGSQK